MRLYIRIVLCTALSFSLVLSRQREGCIGIMNDTYGNCTHRSPDFLSRGKKMNEICREALVRNNRTSNHNKASSCLNNTLCNKSFNMSIFHNQLFAITMKDTVLSMLKRCCGTCARCNVAENLNYITDIKPASVNPADIIFPVLGYDSLVSLHGYNYLPTYDVPSSYYFVLKQTNKEMVMKVIYACMKMWPLIIISLLLALISGFITWAVETQNNNREFPRPFFNGLFEGFWWSFITMTTVGYGDKCPKSYFGRIFAVVWIFIGINVCATFTATLTNEIMTFHSNKNTDMSGRRVGVLKHRLHDANIISQHGGVLIEGTYEKTVYGIVELIDMLHAQKIDGFLINRNTYYFFTRRIKAEKYKDAALSIRDIDMVKTEKFMQGGEGLSCGMLIKDDTDYDYFKALLNNNRLSLQTCNSVKLNYKRTELSEEHVNLFSPKGGVLKVSLLVCLSLLGVMFLFGCCYEINRVCKRPFFKKRLEDILKELSRIDYFLWMDRMNKATLQKDWDLKGTRPQDEV